MSTAFGQCSSTTYIASCKIYVAYSNRVCKYKAYPGYFGNLAAGLESNGWASRGYMATVVQTGNTPPSNRQFRCYNSACSSDSKSMTVTIGVKTFTCSTNSQTITDSSFSGTFYCPTNIAQFCSTQMTCTDYCGGAYVCLKGQCVGVNNCPAGQYPYEGKCVACDTSCATCDVATVCLTCTTGYLPGYLGLCLKCPVNSVYNSATLRCDCNAGLYLSNNECIKDCPVDNYKYKSDCLKNCPDMFKADKDRNCVDCEKADCSDRAGFTLFKLNLLGKVISV